MNTITAHDVARYIASKTDIWGETQLQKLVYYAQCWSLAWDGQPLFDDEIQAWKNGPVLPTLRHCTRTLAGDDGAIQDDRMRATVDAVVGHYARMSGTDLSELSHNQRPWKEARGTLEDGAPSARAIDSQVMRQWASDEVISGADAPVRRPVQHKEADPARVAELGRNGARAWSKTLELLAR